jgi:hypothetical protein
MIYPGAEGPASLMPQWAHNKKKAASVELVPVLTYTKESKEILVRDHHPDRQRGAAKSRYMW